MMEVTQTNGMSVQAVIRYEETDRKGRGGGSGMLETTVDNLLPACSGTRRKLKSIGKVLYCRIESRSLGIELEIEIARVLAGRCD